MIEKKGEDSYPKTYHQRMFELCTVAFFDDTSPADLFIYELKREKKLGLFPN